MAALKTRNSGQWTESRYFSFIKSALRGASTKWGPMHQCLKRARVGYGEYRCDQCGTIGPPSLPPKEGGKRRIKNIVADHIHPVIDPVKGFESWDVLIARLFVEEDGYQALCHKCHSEKSAEENALRKEVRNNNKEQ
jgi:hypothetical protein